MLVLRAHPHVDRPLDVDEHARQRQAALLERLLVVARPLEHRVDERGHRRVGVDAVDEHAVHDAELGGGEADPERVVHQLAHAPDLLDAAPSSKRSTSQRAALEHRIAVLAHEPQRGVAPRTRLGIEPRVAVLRTRARPRPEGSDPRGPSARSLLRVDVHGEGHIAESAVARRPLDRRAPRPRSAAARSVVLTTTWKRSRPRRRNSGAGPSTSVPATATPSATRPAAAARGAARPRPGRRPGSGRRTAGSAAPRGARARRPRSPACRAARPPRSPARPAPWSGPARARRAARAPPARRAGRSARTSAPRRGSPGSAGSSRRRARRRA